MWSIQNLFCVYSESGKVKRINIYSNGGNGRTAKNMGQIRKNSTL